MILIAGGTSRLGRSVTPRLLEHGLPLRVLTRNPAGAERLWDGEVELIEGDVRDPASVERAMVGVGTVISAIHGFAGAGNVSPEAVDWEGNRNLIRAAEEAGTGHFILISVLGASPDHPMDLFRMKYRAETELQRSRLAWTIIRPAAYMELWASMIGEPLLNSGKTRIFGRGDNPINFVSIEDVARFVDRAVLDESMRGEIVEIGGPENLTMNEIVQILERVSGTPARMSHIPLSMMRVMARLMSPVNPQLARQIGSGVVMDTTDMRFDASDTVRRYPAITPTRFEEVIHRVYYPAGREGEASYVP